MRMPCAAQKLCTSGASKMPDIPSAEYIGLSVNSSVQDGIVGGIRQNERPDNHGLNHVGRISQAPSETCRFAG
jgi:hypothetical protein